MKSRFIAGSIGATILFAGAAPAFAQAVASEETSGQLEQVTVTAERREESLQKTAVSVTAISGEDLAKAGQTTGSQFIAQALQNVAGVEVGGGQSGNIAIRGITPVGAIQQGFAPSTATYVDGVFSPLGGGSQFGSTGGNLDTQRLELLRGPQGTLYGVSATGGVLNIVTNDPVLGEYQANGTVELGTLELRHFGGALNVPVTSGFAARAAFDSVDQDGFLSNGQGDQHQRQMRLKVLYQGSRFSVMADYYYQIFAGGFGGGTVPIFCTPVRPGCTIPAGQHFKANTPTAVYNAPSNLWRVNARVEADLGFADATFVPSYDQVFVPSNNNLGPVFNSISSTPYTDSYYDEFRLNSKPESKLIWVVGANYYHVAQAANSAFFLAANNLLIQLTNTIGRTGVVGEFAQATYPVTDTFRVTAGVRYTHEIIHSITQNIAVTTPFSGTFNSTNYKFRLEKDLGQEHLLYAEIATGFAPGGLPVYNCASFGAGPTQCPPSIKGTPTNFAAEKVTSYEIGSKNQFLDNRLQLNGAVYYYDYPSLQGGGVLFGSAGTPVGELVVTNPATFKGAELEAVFLLTKDDKISLSPSWLDAHYTSLSPLTIANLWQGTQLAYAPHWQVSGRIDHTFPLPGGSKLTASADASYRSDQFIHQSLQPVAFQPAYTITDVTLAYTSADGQYDVTGYVRNLTDEYYKTGAQLPGPQTPAAGNNIAVGYPRTYGLVLSAHF
jgi:iron complex outermembrane receptor protein